MDPVVIELAINGETSKKRNPNVPHTPEEIAGDAIACFRAGAATLHNHMGDINLTGQAATDRYALAWRPIREAIPDVILCPTTQQAPDLDTRLNFLPSAKQAGARQASIDPGVDNFATTGENGLPGPIRAGLDYSIDMVERAFRTMAEVGVGPALGIYEPGFLRLVLAFKQGGTLPRGTLARL
jgi:3-keto-5-aminohexanoate cleavage enzyme